MRGGFASQRRADEFEALVSRRAGGQTAGDADYAELLEVVGSLRTLPEVSARPEFVTDLRSRLMAEAAAQPARPARALDDALVARLTPTQRRGHNERRLATLLGGFAVVAATGSMAMASQAALPGDALYPMKRAIENAQTNLQGDDAGKAQTLLAHAEQRLAEAEALSERGDGSADEIAATLQDFSEQTNQATSLAIDEYHESGDQDSLTDVRTFAGRSMSELTNLGESVPSDARPAVITAAQTVLQIDTAAQQACPVCGGSIAELPEFAARSLERLLLPEGTTDTSAAEAPKVVDPPKKTRNKPTQVDPTGTDDQPGTDDPEDVLPGDDPAEEVLPDDGDDPLGEITDGLGEALGGGGKKDGDQQTDDGDGGVVGDVVDGVTGLLGGLLGGGTTTTP